LEARAGEGTRISDRIGDQRRQSRAELIGSVKAICDQLLRADEECDRCEANLELLRAQHAELERPENDAHFDEAEQRQQAELDVAKQRRTEILRTMQQALEALSGPVAVAPPFVSPATMGPSLPSAPAGGLDGLLSLGPLPSIAP
jgi:hypothetical protein